MAKQFKLKFSRVFPSFHSCRSKDVADNPLPPVFRVTSKPFDLHLRPPPTSLRRHVASAIASVGCGCRSKPRRSHCNPSPPPPPSDFHWQKEEKWHVVARISNHRRISADDEDDSSDYIYPDLNSTARKRQQKQQRNKSKSRSKKKKKNRPRVRISTSSADHSGWFSSDGDGNDDEDRDEYDVDDDTETLMSSSRTFSDESARDFTNPTLQTIQEQKPRKGPGRRRVKTVLRRQRIDSETEKEPVPCPSPETPSPARVSLLGRIGAEGKVRESVAVVKRSEDPYGDFKRSMVEMILEKEMYGVEELEQLLHCFLSLNSRAHHRVIVQAFSEIWDAIFFCSAAPCNFNVGNSRAASAATAFSLL